MNKITVYPDRRHQTFESFGASAAWWSQVVGKMPISDEIARLLYSKSEGIGLNIYRYNLGAGTMNDGQSPYWNWERATEKFENDTNAVSMMQKCVDAGADEVIVFVNSPPVELTTNGKGRCERPLALNIKPENYKAFADYCFDCCEKLLEMGMPVKYLSPVNEPSWVWCDDKQEGCHYMPRQVKEVFAVFARELEKRERLRGIVRLAGTECGDIRWLNKSYSRAVLNNPQVRRNLDSIDYHAYFLHPVKPFFSDREAYLRRYKRFHDKKYPGTKLKMTEWCHMQGGTDCSMESGIVVANTVYQDLTFADAVSWQHWVAVAFGGYCDGIIYVDRENQTYELTKRYYVTGNFSKFIVGATRLEAECENSDIKCLCFIKDGRYIFIAINNSRVEQVIDLSQLGSDAAATVTDEQHSLEESAVKTDRIVLTPLSVSTFVISKQ